MITLITGLTGSGKTWLAAKILYNEWKLGAKIFSNTPLLFSKDNENIEQFNALAELYYLNNGVIFIDEAQKLFDARRWGSFPTMFAEKIAQHRKHFLDFITTSQDIGHVDLRFRDLIHERYDCVSIFRLPVNERVHPILQLIRTVKKKRELTENDRTRWVNSESPKLHFLSRYWTKKIYETYADIGLTQFICWTKYEKKKWLTKIVGRELLQSGRAIKR